MFKNVFLVCEKHFFKFQMDVCALCEKPLTNNDEVAVLTDKGSQGINQISALKQDNILTTAGQKVHTDCRKKYTDKRGVKILNEIDTNNNESRNLRSVSDFDFKHKCLFCGKNAKHSSRKRGHDVYPVRSIDFQSKIKDTCVQRNDKWSYDVASRLASVIDLPAADAVYHQACSVNFRTGKCIPLAFQSIPSKSPSGRPCRDENEGFLTVVEYLEDCENLVTLTDLIHVMEKVSGENAYSAKHLKRKLLDYFGDSLVISGKEGQADKLTLKQTASSILHSFVNNKRSRSEAEEKERLIKTVAKLIKSDILEISTDNSVYPPPDSIASIETNRNFIPESLLLLLNLLLCGKETDMKIGAIGQAIIQCCRPRGIIAPLQIGLAVQLYHHFGSRFLIDCLNSMGFCSSYREVQKFESNAAAMLNISMPHFFPGSFVQFSADNVDHNSRTIDGYDTFHGMGIIACNTPGIPFNMSLPRREININEVVELGHIEIKYFKEPEHELTAATFLSLSELDERSNDNENTIFDLFSKLVYSLRPSRPSWSGFMHLYDTNKTSVQKSNITFLPMIDMSPSDLSCINSTLHFIAKISTTHNVAAVVTFDQPLFQKASYILDTEQSSSPIKNVVLRLGGFHTEMSFLGCIGHLMAGSGLREVLETVYSPNAVVHMLTGKAVSRAVRGHFMVDTALHTLILSSALDIRCFPRFDNSAGLGNIPEEQIEAAGSREDDCKTQLDDSTDCTSSMTQPVVESRPENDQMLQNLLNLYDLMESEGIQKEDVCADTRMRSLCEILKVKTNYLKEYRTARLWIQYMEMVSVLRDFIRAERTGNWYGHLKSVFRMLPFFAASGHNLYLKSAYIYLQNMLKLKDTHPDVHLAFVSGLHTIQRTEKNWAGLSTDLVIEQVLMRSLKTAGGLTRGRGVTENQRALWLMSMPAKAEINNAMLDVLKMNNTTDGHRDITRSRIARDTKDTAIIHSFLEERNPFTCSCFALRNIESGITASDTVNADNAIDIGNRIIQKMIGQPQNRFTFQRSWQAVPLSEKTSVTLLGEKINIDTQLLFQRLITAAGRLVDDTGDLFQYELCSVPSSLFDNSGMPREPAKALLAESIWKLGDCSADNYPKSDFDVSVIDGGSLLQKLPWQKGASFGYICEEYISYVKQRYTNPVVVFDGYNNGPSTKDVTHLRRQKGVIGTKVLFTRATPCKTKKDVFLKNIDNKINFIDLLMESFKQHEIPVKQAISDADFLIVQTAVELAETVNTVVIGEDTDLLVLLCYHVDSMKHEVYFQPDFRPKRGKGKKIWDVKKTRQLLGFEVCNVLPFLHALTGCDTTSKIHGIGKASALKVVCTKQDFRDIAFKFINAKTKDDVKMWGEQAIIYLYEGQTSESLNHLRFRKFARKVSCSTSFVEVHSLPPTSSAAGFHCMRVFWQTQTWMGNADLDPMEWGWEIAESLLIPVKMTLPPAPDYLLKVIHCGCKLGCDSKRCNCRKHGLECSAGCGNCRGVSCSNAPTPSVEDADSDDGLY